MALRYDLDTLRKSPDHLYVEDPHTWMPLPGYISLDADGVVTVEPGSVMDGVPMDVYHGRRLRWRVPGDLYGPELADWLEAAPQRALLERVHRGHTLRWGADQPYGVLDEDAEAASRALEAAIAQEPFEVRVISAAAWLFGDSRLEEIWDDTVPIDEVLDAIEADARDLPVTERLYVTGSVREALLDEAEARWRQDPDALGPAHRAALQAAGRIPAAAEA